jgi:hypothetical protein
MVFYVNEDWKIWLLPDSDAPEVAQRLILTLKVMITLFWNPIGLHGRDFLSSEWFCGDLTRNVLTLIHFLLIVAAGHKQRHIYSAHGQLLDIQIKSCPVKLSQMSVHMAPRPPYSPDLAPSTFSHPDL